MWANNAGEQVDMMASGLEFVAAELLSDLIERLTSFGGVSAFAELQQAQWQSQIVDRGALLWGVADRLQVLEIAVLKFPAGFNLCAFTPVIPCGNLNDGAMGIQCLAEGGLECAS